MAAFFRQSSWLGIQFSDLAIDLNPFGIAGGDFYDAFYEKLFQTKPNYSDFPLVWRDQKRIDAEFLSQLIPKNSHLLSYGCGIGYLESCLMEFLGPFYVTDFSPYILKYRPDLAQYFLNIDELGNLRFSHILLNQVTYALNESDLRSLLYRLHDCLKIEGTLILTFSEIDFKNGESRSYFRGGLFSSVLFSRLKFLRSLMFRNGYEETSQGWGFHRSKKEMIDISTSMVFEVLTFHRSESQSYLLLKKLPRSVD